jgi:hypothetical protein
MLLRGWPDTFIGLLKLVLEERTLFNWYNKLAVIIFPLFLVIERLHHQSTHQTRLLVYRCQKLSKSSRLKIGTAIRLWIIGHLKIEIHS